MFKITLDAKLPAEKAFADFYKEFQETLQTGMDEAIAASVPALQSELKRIVNTAIRNVQETTAQSAKNENVNIPKADEDLLNHLTGIDIKEINKTKKTTTTIDSKTMVVQRDKWGGPLARVRMDVGPGETVESQYAKARNFFNAAMFAIPQRDGSVRYLVNNGADLSRYIKIVCSTDTGITDKSEKRLERFKQVGGTAEWTLKQKAFDEVIEHENSGFLDLSQVVTNLKDGKYREARLQLERHAAANANSRPLIEKLSEQVDKLDSNKDVSKDIQLQQDIINLINGIKVLKQFTKDKTLYTLVTDTSLTESENQSFFDSMMAKISDWVLNYEVKWFNSLVIKVQKLIKKYTNE